MSADKVKFGVKGLANLGNSSGFDAVLQCLIAYEPLRNFWQSGEYEAFLNMTNPLGSKGQVAVEFAKLVQRMHGKITEPGGEPIAVEAEQDPSTPWYHNESERLVPYKLKRALGELIPNLLGFIKLDEFDEIYLCLIDTLHEDFNLVQKRPAVKEIERNGRSDKDVCEEFWKMDGLRNDSIIRDRFFGVLSSSFECPVCLQSPETISSFSGLSVPLNSTCTNALDCLRELEKAVVIDDDKKEEHHCSLCKDFRTPKTKKRKVLKFPEVLVLSLDRSTAAGDKCEAVIDLPLTKESRIDLKGLINSEEKSDTNVYYECFAVLDHLGIRHKSGHSRAFVKDKDVWYCTDDASVIKVEDISAIANKYNYIIFLHKCKS
jgi:ubiquitin carboxyl-terminal hydrolase 8